MSLTNVVLALFVHVTPSWPINVQRQSQNWDTLSYRLKAVGDELLPALFMAGRAPFRAQRRFPPKGTYCWLSGKLSVFRSCLRCFSLKMEWTVFKKSFLLSGELQDIKKGVDFVSVPNRGWGGTEVVFHGQQNLASTPIDPYLQHSWNALSGRPSDSDFVWTISHTAEVSQSEEENNSGMIRVILVTRQSVQTRWCSFHKPGAEYWWSYLCLPGAWSEGHRLESCDGIGRGLFPLKIATPDGSHPIVIQSAASLDICKPLDNNHKAQFGCYSKMALSDEKHTIFFFCLDPSLQTKTTAVLNTKYESRKKEYRWSQRALGDQAD